MKLNKAEKFVKRQFESGLTRNMVREKIYEKLGTWNFPPEYENALATQDPNYDTNNEPLLGVDYLDDFVCGVCGNCHELCFCGTEVDMDERPDHSEEAELAVFGHSPLQHEKCVFCHKNPCVCETIELQVLPEPGGQAWENMVDFMRKDLDSGGAYSKVISTAHNIIENSIRCLECDAVTPQNENSTGYCETCGSANVKHRDFYEEFARWKKEKGGNSDV